MALEGVEKGWPRCGNAGFEAMLGELNSNYPVLYRDYVDYWDVLLVLRINGLFHPYISRLDTWRK